VDCIDNILIKRLIKDFTVDLNGKVVRTADDTSEKGNVTCTFLVKAIDHTSSDPLLNPSGSSITVKNGTLSNGNETQLGQYVASVNGLLTDVTLTFENVTATTDRYNLETGEWTVTNSIDTDDSESNAGWYGKGNSYGYYLAGHGNYTIDGGSIKATATALEVRNGGDLTIKNNPTITSTSTGYFCAPNGSGTTTTGAAIAIAPHVPATDVMNIDIQSGTFTGPVAFYDVNPQNNTVASVAPSISGGTFDGAIITYHDGFVTGGTFLDTATAPFAKVAAGSTLTKANTEVYYFDLNKAIAEAADGDTITVVKSGDTTIEIPESATGKTLTIDLGGNTITPSEGATSLVEVKASNANITITNGTLKAESATCTTGITDTTASNVNLTIDDVNLSVAAVDSTTDVAINKTSSGTLTITNSTLAADTAIKTSATETNVSGSTVTGTTGIEVASGAVTVTNGTTVTGTENGITVSNGSVAVNSSTVASTSSTTGSAINVAPVADAKVEVTVKGSELSSANKALTESKPAEGTASVTLNLESATVNGDVETESSATVSNTTFNGEVSDPIKDALKGDDSQKVVEIDNGDGTTTTVVETVYTASLNVSGHVQNIADIPSVKTTTSGENSSTSLKVGTTGRALRLEGISVSTNVSPTLAGGITYRAHVENIGWQDWKFDGELAGTTGQGLRMEALEFSLYGDLADHYDVYYRVHVENYGWMPWAKNGEAAGTQGLGLRIEAVEIMLVCKDVTSEDVAPTNPEGQNSSFIAAAVGGTATVAGKGTVETTVSAGSTFIGTTGEGRALETIALTLGDLGVNGGIEYTVHTENYSWLEPAADGEATGKSGLRIESIILNLTGDAADLYKLEYRAHVENQGWGPWVSEGYEAGTTGLGLRLEALEIRLVSINAMG
jgi:uncharacterized protein YjdB